MSSNAENAIWVGPEPLRRHFAAHAEDALRIDCADPEAVAAMRGGGLFTNRRDLRNVEQLDEKTMVHLVEQLGAWQDPFTGQAEKLSAKQEKILGQVARIEKLTLTGSPGRKLLARIAERIGVQLGGDALAVLHQRTGHDPGRAVGVIEALAAGGYERPTASQVERLAGNSREEGLPWVLFSQLENGDIRSVRDTLRGMEAIPTIAFMVKRAIMAALLAENPGHDAETLRAALGDTTDGAIAHGRRLAARLGVTDSTRLVVRLLEADALAKRSRPHDALALAVGHLALLLSADVARNNAPKHVDSTKSGATARRS